MTRECKNRAGEKRSRAQGGGGGDDSDADDFGDDATVSSDLSDFDFDIELEFNCTGESVDTQIGNKLRPRCKVLTECPTSVLLCCWCVALCK